MTKFKSVVALLLTSLFIMGFSGCATTSNSKTKSDVTSDVTSNTITSEFTTINVDDLISQVENKTSKEVTSSKPVTTSQSSFDKYLEENKTSNYEVQKKSQTVYITPTGERYHRKSTCGGKNSYGVTLDDAKSGGYTPCKKCW